MLDVQAAEQRSYSGSALLGRPVTFRPVPVAIGAAKWRDRASETSTLPAALQAAAQPPAGATLASAAFAERSLYVMLKGVS